MRKINNVICIICSILSLIFILQLPLTIPVHYSKVGVDRYGSRWELVVIPITIFVLSLVFSFIINQYIKKDVEKAYKLEFVSLIITVISFISQLNLLLDTYLYFKGTDFNAFRSFLFTGLFIMIIGIFVYLLDDKYIFYFHIPVIHKNRNNRLYGIVLVLLGFLSTIYAIINLFF